MQSGCVASHHHSSIYAEYIENHVRTDKGTRFCARANRRGQYFITRRSQNWKSKLKLSVRKAKVDFEFMMIEREIGIIFTANYYHTGGISLFKEWELRDNECLNNSAMVRTSFKTLGKRHPTKTRQNATRLAR
jgi:hypothetical protein